MKAYRILLFISFVIALLALLCIVFPENGVAFGSSRLFFPTMEEIMIREKSQSVSEKMDNLMESLRMKNYQDSLSTADFLVLNDSLLFYSQFVTENSARIYLPNGDLTFFDSVFDKLTNCKERKEVVHILHYGDSQIEGDRITGFVRQRLQERFGGTGPGLLPAVQVIPSSAVGQTASENIERFIISGNFLNKAEHNRYGVLGQIAEIKDHGSISVTARNLKETFTNVKSFSKIRLFTSHNAPDFQATLSCSKESVTRSLKEGGIASRTLTWNLKSPVKQFTLQFSGSAGVTGISVDGEYGVAVDNIPLRGSSGTFFSQIDANSLAPVLKELDAQLILLEFGGNMMPVIKNQKHVENYQKSMAKQIGFLKKIYPAAKIILIGPSDMSVKLNGRLQTIPFLKETVQGLKETALQNGAGFWDMYEVMGGENSMIAWVDNKPALASSDYIHFTHRGAEKIAEAFCISLMNYYDFAVLRNNLGLE